MPISLFGTLGVLSTWIITEDVTCMQRYMLSVPKFGNDPPCLTSSSFVNFHGLIHSYTVSPTYVFICFFIYYLYLFYLLLFICLCSYLFLYLLT